MIVSKFYKNKLDKIYSSALEAADPIKCVSKYLIVEQNVLHVGKKKYNLDFYKRILLISLGKAATEMARGANKALGKKITGGIVVSNTRPKKNISNFKFILSSHPVPDERSVKAANAILELLSTTKKNDLVLF